MMRVSDAGSQGRAAGQRNSIISSDMQSDIGGLSMQQAHIYAKETQVRKHPPSRRKTSINNNNFHLRSMRAANQQQYENNRVPGMEDKGVGADDDDEIIMTDRYMNTTSNGNNTTEQSKDKIGSQKNSKSDIRQHK